MRIQDSDDSPLVSPSTAPSNSAEITPPTISSLALSTACLAISIVELTVQLGLLAVAAASNILPSDPILAADQMSSVNVSAVSAGDSRSSSPSPVSSSNSQPPLLSLSAQESWAYRPPSLPFNNFSKSSHLVTHPTRPGFLRRLLPARM